MYLHILKAVAIDKIIVCLLEKDNSFFVFASKDDCIVSIKEINCFKSAEEYCQTLIEKFEINECGIELKL